MYSTVKQISLNQVISYLLSVMIQQQQEWTAGMAVEEFKNSLRSTPIILKSNFNGGLPSKPGCHNKMSKMNTLNCVRKLLIKPNKT